MIITNAISYFLGGLLLQSDEKGQWRPISLSRRVRRKSESNYGTDEKGCLSFVYAPKNGGAILKESLSQ